MAATTFTGTGSWSDGTKWSLGVQPTAADDATITQDADCTLDAITCVAKSVTIASRTSGTTGGKLRPSTTAHSKLVVEQGINSTGSATAAYSSHFLFDMSAAASYNCEIVLNNVRQTTDSIITTQATTHGGWLAGNYTLKAAAKTRHTTLSSALSVGASSCSVPDVTGWIVGDAIIFAMTDGAGATSAPHTDIVEISSITGAGPYTVNFSATPDTTKNPGAVATCAYAHASGSPVGNLSGNLIFRPGTAGDKTYVHGRADTANQNADSYVTDVEFRSMAVPAVFVFGCFSSYGASTYLKSVSNNSFYNFTTTSSYTALSIYTSGSPGLKAAFTRQNNIFYAAPGVSSNPTMYTVGNVSPIGPDEDYVIFSGGTGVTVAMPGQHQVNPKISGLRRGTAYSADAAIVVNISGITITNPQIWSCYGAAIGGTQPCTIEDGSIGSGTFSGCNNAAGIVAYAGTTVATDFTTQSANTVKDMNPAYSKSGFVQFVNKDDDLAVQQIYSYHSNTDPVIQKDVSIYNRSTSSICMTCNHADAITTSFSVLAKAGETIKVIGWVRKSSSPAYGASTLPSITISGLGITQVVATMAGGTAADAWEELTLTATNPSSTNDGNFTITLTAQSGTAGAKAYFSGIPNSPFVTRCRHYGHLFQETSPTREVDDLSSANFATADGYTGFSITWGASTSPITLSASHTFQELFDYHQAKACQNGDKVLAITGAGVAGSPALFTENDSNVTINTGYTLSGSGSLTIGGTSTLTTEFAGGSAYTYTDGTWSQATTVPSFSGGAVTLATAGAYVFTVSSGTLTMTATSTAWDFSGLAITGTLYLRTDTGTRAVTVLVPAGTTVDTTGETNITVNYTSVTRGLDFSGIVSGSTVKIFNTGTQTVRATPTEGGGWIWSEAGGSDVTVDYTIQKAGYIPIRITGVTVNSAVVATTIQQQTDRAYVASSGLTFNTNCFYTAGTKLAGLTVASTLQNLYSHFIEQWITLGDATGEQLANVAFPLVANGPNSFSWIDGNTFDLTTYSASITNLSRDGMRYLNTGGNVTAIWAALWSSGVPAGEQVRYQQTDAGTTVNADGTGDIDELVQILSDPNGDGVYTDGYDKRGYMVLKCQADGYDQAEVNVVTLYGNLEDQLYVIGLTPLSNGLATGNPSLATAPTISQGTYVEDGKTFSVKIVDGATANTGTMIQRWLRYNFEIGGTFPPAQSEDAFNWHDLVRVNGTKFKTVNGTVYGTATTKGVLVYMNDETTLHPDFNLFTADNGTTYSIAVAADISITGIPTAAAASTRLQIINYTGSQASIWVANTAYATGAIVKRPAGLGSEQTAGLYFRATTGGTSHATLEPTWNTTVGGTTTDNDITWTTYAVLFYDADPVSGSYVTTYTDGNQFLAGETVKIRFAEMDAGTSFKRYDISLVAATTGFSTVVDEIADEVYATNGLDGSAYEGTYSPDFTDNYIVLDTNTDYSGVSAYAYFCYILTTSNGMYEFWGGVTAIDVGNYRIESDILNLFFDETNGFVKQTDPSRIFRKDGTRPALDPTTGGHGLEINWRVPVSVVSTGGSALTPTESAYLLALPVATANASAVRTNLTTELADIVTTRKLTENDRTFGFDGTITVKDDNGAAYKTGLAHSDPSGTVLYDGTAAIHHTSRLT